jgi:hypothetical protein
LHSSKGAEKERIEPTKWTWGIRCTTHKFHFRTKQFDRLEIHLQRHFQKKYDEKEKKKNMREYKGYSGEDSGFRRGEGGRHGAINES